MSDEELRRLERLVDAGDAGALDRLVGELTRLGRFEELLARTRGLLDLVQHREHARGRLFGPLRTYDVVEAVRRLLAPESPGWVLAFRSMGEGWSPSPHWPRVLGYVAAAHVGGRIEIGVGCCDPVELVSFHAQLEARAVPEAVFEVASRATFAAPRDEHLTLAPATARAWARWCEAEPRTQRAEGNVEHVRLRPGMYVGDPLAYGLHLLVEECLGDVIEEFTTGAIGSATVVIGADATLTVSDDGDGLPVHPRSEGEPCPLENLFVRLEHRRLPREARAFGTYPGLMGAGTAVVNFLSEWFEVETVRDGELWSVRFEQGQLVRRAARHGRTDRRGTTVRFLPDRAIFAVTDFDHDRIARRLEEVAFLFPGLRLALEDRRDGRRVEHRSERGLVDVVERLGANRRAFAVSQSVDVPALGGAVRVDVALGWGPVATNLLSFANGARTENDGTHLDGLMAGLRAAFEGSRRDPLVGLVAAVAVRVPEPQFEGAARSRLANPEVASLVSAIVTPPLRGWLARRA